MGMDFQQTFPGSSGNPESQHFNMTPDIIQSPWMQVLPSIMPWTIENRPNLVRFGETSGESFSLGISSPKIKYYKRKSDLDCNTRPTKMHITEEKMAAQFKNMHISNNYVDEKEMGDVLNKSLGSSLPTLVLSKEVQNLARFQECLIPESLLPKPEKHARALVLWKPPRGSLTSQIISNLCNEEDEEVDNVNNNTVTPDLNAMTSSGYSSLDTEMEL